MRDLLYDIWVALAVQVPVCVVALLVPRSALEVVLLLGMPIAFTVALLLMHRRDLRKYGRPVRWGD